MARTGHKSWATDAAGNIIAGAAVEVRLKSDNSLAVIYDAVSGGSALANPFTTASDGSFEFFTDADRYDVLVGSGASQVTIPVDLTDARSTQRFTTRAEAVDWIGTNGSSSPDGYTVWWGEYGVVKSTGAAAISDMTGYVPIGRPSIWHWGFDGSTDDFLTEMQALVDYGESTVSDNLDRVELDFGGVPVYVSGAVVNAEASIDYYGLHLVAHSSGSWGADNFNTTAIGSYKAPDHVPLLKIGSRFKATPDGNHVSPRFIGGAILDCAYKSSGLYCVGVTTPDLTGVIEEPRKVGLYYDNIGRMDSIKMNVRGFQAGADENIPPFRKARGIWAAEGDVHFASGRVSNCQINVYPESSPLFFDYLHTFAGWKGTKGSGTGAIIEIEASGNITNWAINTAGTGYAVDDNLYAERYKGDTGTDTDQHWDPDNWDNIACFEVTSVDGSGGITGLALATDRDGNEADGSGYGTHTIGSGELRDMYYIQEIMPVNVWLESNGGLAAREHYLDKGRLHCKGSFKYRTGETQVTVKDDEVPLKGMIIFESTGSTDDIHNFYIGNVSLNMSGTPTDPEKLILVDETAGSFRTCTAHIGIDQSTVSTSPTKTFPHTVGFVGVAFDASKFNTSGGSGNHYLDWDLKSYGFASTLYDLPASKKLSFKQDGSSVSDPTQFFGFTDQTDGVYRVHVPDAVSTGGATLYAEWGGMFRSGDDDGGLKTGNP